MATDKKSFVLYCDLIHTVNKLPDEQAGKLLKIILDYVNDNNPIVDDLLLSVSFEPIKQQLKRDLTKWTESAPDRSEKARKAGLASAKARQLKATKGNSLVKNELKPTKSTVSVSVNVSDNVNGIPIKEDFIKYAVDKKSNIDRESVGFKYESWVENGWKDGNDKDIKNWKTKLLNTLPHLKVNISKTSKVSF